MDLWALCSCLERVYFTTPPMSTVKWLSDIGLMTGYAWITSTGGGISSTSWNSHSNVFWGGWNGHCCTDTPRSAPLLYHCEIHRLVRISWPCFLNKELYPLASSLLRACMLVYSPNRDRLGIYCLVWFLRGWNWRVFIAEINADQPLTSKFNFCFRQHSNACNFLSVKYLFQVGCKKKNLLNPPPSW